MSEHIPTAQALAQSYPTGERRFARIFIALTAFMIFTAFLFPRFMAYAPALLALIGYLGFRPIFKTWPVIPKKATFVILSILILILTSSLWSNITPEHSDIALKRSLKVAMVLLPALPLLGVFNTLPPLLLRAYMPKYIMGAFFAGAAVLVFDLYSNSLLYSLIRDLPWPDINYNLSGLNRSVVFATITALTLPAFISGYDAHTKKKLLALTAIFMGAILYQTDSQSSHLAFICGLIVFALCPAQARKKIWFILTAGFIGVFIAAPFIAKWLFSDLAPMISDVSWFQHGYAANRMEIWDYVSRYALESPWIGYGIDTTRLVTNFDSAELYQPGKSILHPHNFAIQIWIEFGALGVAIFSALFYALFATIRGLSQPLVRATALSIFVAIAAAGSTGYGLWQGWWIGTFVMMAALCLCLVKITQDENMHKKS